MFVWLAIGLIIGILIGRYIANKERKNYRLYKQQAEATVLEMQLHAKQLQELLEESREASKQYHKHFKQACLIAEDALQILEDAGLTNQVLNRQMRTIRIV